MSVVLFTESWMRRGKEGSVYPVRDQYPRFIRAAAPHLGRLTMAARCETDAFSAAGNETLEEDDTFSFVPLPFYESTEDFYGRILTVLPPSVGRVVRLVREHDVVMVRVHHCLAFWIALAARVFNRPLAVYWAGPAITEAVTRNYSGSRMRDRAARIMSRVESRVHRWIARLAELHFFIDEQQFELMGKPENTHWVVPTLIGPADIQQAPLPRNSEYLKLVFGGRLLRHKGVFELLEATASVRQDREISLDLAGVGPEEDSLKRRTQELELNSSIRFHGQLEWERFQKLMRKSHVFVLPSYAEGLPKVLWEAWAAGMAVITCPVGSIPRYVTDGVDGILVEPGSSEQLADAIRRLTDDDEFRRHLARKGIEAAREHTWDEEIRRISFRLNQLTTGRGQSAPTEDSTARALVHGNGAQ